MKRREFLKVTSTAACAAALLPSVGLVFAGPTKSFNLAGVSMTAYCVIPNKELREPYLKHLRDLKLDEAPIPSLVSTIAAYTEGG